MGRRGSVWCMGSLKSFRYKNPSVHLNNPPIFAHLNSPLIYVNIFNRLMSNLRKVRVEINPYKEVAIFIKLVVASGWTKD